MKGSLVGFRSSGTATDDVHLNRTLPGTPGGDALIPSCPFKLNQYSQILSLTQSANEAKNSSLLLYSNTSFK